MLFHARARIPDLPRRRQVDPPEAPGSRSPCGSRDRIYEPYAGALAGYLQRRRTSSRCQRNSVAGWTRNEYCLARGRAWVSAASTARSAARRRGRAICRLSTCNSWRRRRISISFSRSELPTRTSNSNKRRTAPSRRRTSSQAADAEFASADRTRCGQRHRTPPDSISDGDASPAADEFLGPTGKRDLSDRVSIRQVFAQQGRVSK